MATAPPPGKAEGAQPQPTPQQKVSNPITNNQQTTPQTTPNSKPGQTSPTAAKPPQAQKTQTVSQMPFLPMGFAGPFNPGNLPLACLAAIWGNPGAYGFGQPPAANQGAARQKRPRKPAQPPEPAPVLDVEVKDGESDLTQIPSEKINQALVRRGFHSGVIARMPEWYNRALLRELSSFWSPEEIITGNKKGSNASTSSTWLGEWDSDSAELYSSSDDDYMEKVLYTDSLSDW